MTGAVITGASTGIGRALAVSLARDGYHVALVARTTENLESVRSEIRGGGGAASAFVIDLRDQDAVLQLPERVASEVGPIEVLANIAGVWHGPDRAYYGPLLHETDPDEILEVLDVGITAPLLLARGFLPQMIAAKRGHILNLSGTFASGARGWIHYFVSKKSLEQFTIGLAEEMRDFEIQVNCISPADVATDAYIRFFPEDAASALGPNEVVEVARWLLSPAARHVTGQIIEVRNRNAHA
jgi:3-oxoacyl-[acyl-carrier protein] reductase